MPLARIGVATDSIILVSQPHDKDDVKRSCGVVEELRHNGLHTYGTERCLMSACCRAVTARGCLKKSHTPPRAGAVRLDGKKHSRTTSSLLKAPAVVKQVSLLAAVTTQARGSAGSDQQNFGGFA